MPARTTSSILLVTRQDVFRADFAAGDGRPAALNRAPRQDASTPIEALQAAIALGGKLGRAVWILCEDLWTQSVVLSAQQVAGLPEDLLAQALAFEVEPISGLPADDCVLGFRATGEANGMQGYWITQAPIYERDEMQQTVRKNGGRLMGICHPGGAPSALGSYRLGEAWRRLELWDRLTVWTKCDDGQHPQTRVLNATPTQPAWQRLSSFLEEDAAGHSELLSASDLAPGTEIGPRIEWHRLRLDEMDDVSAWLSAWHACLSSAPALVPVMKPAVRQASAKLAWGVGAAAAVLMFIACAAHATYIQKTTASAAEDLKQSQRPHADVRNLAAEVKKLKKEWGSLQEVLEAHARREHLLGSELKRQRLAWARLLDALAEECPRNLVVKSIQGEQGGSAVLSGLSLDDVTVDMLGTRLATRLGSQGWRVHPPQKEGLNTRADGGPWSFNLSLERIAEAEKPPMPVPGDKLTQAGAATRGGVR